jgi:hypothetical protein
VDIGRPEGNGQRNPLPVDHKMALRARLAAIRGIRPARWAPPGAGTVLASIAARAQSIWSASPRQCNNRWCTLRHPSCACHSCRRRPPVLPLPPPSSWGNNSHAMPLLSTNRIPVSVARLVIRRRPPSGRGGGGGIKGSRTAHSSSDNNSLAISVLPLSSAVYRRRGRFVRDSKALLALEE